MHVADGIDVMQCELRMVNTISDPPDSQPIPQCWITQPLRSEPARVPGLGSRSLLLVTFLTGMTLLLAGACTTVADNDATRHRQPSARSSANGVVPIVRDENDLNLPLDEYDLDANGRSIVQTARYKLISECLSRYGLIMRKHDTSPAEYPANAGYLGWLGALNVSKNGYTGTEEQLLRHVPAARDGIRGYFIPSDQDPVHTGTVSTFRGKKVPQGGCDGEAQRRLNGNSPGPDGVVPAKPHIYKELYVLMEDAAEAAVSFDGSRMDKRVAVAVEGWASCMKSKGYSYNHPWDAEYDPRWAGRREVPRGQHLARPSKDELETAVADEQCRMKVNYSGARKAAWTDAQLRIIAADPEKVKRLGNLQRSRYENALRVLNSSKSQPDATEVS